MSTPQQLDAPGRLAALAETYLMDSPPEEDFDRATRLARRLLGSPVSLVSLVDERRQFFKSAVGLAEPWASRRQTPLSHSFCQHVITSGRPLVVEDSATDERVRGNGAIEDLGVAAYLGVPVRGPDGDTVGTLCAIETNPRRWTADDLAVLSDLAAGITTEIALRVHATRLEAVVSGAAHELRTPLTSIRVRLEDVASWPHAPADVREELAATLGQVVRLSDQLDAHLELARRGWTATAEDVAMDEVLRQVGSRWEDVATGRGRALSVIAGGPARASVPPAAVVQIVDLLVEEALERSEGAITLELADERGAVRLRVRARTPDAGASGTPQVAPGGRSTGSRSGLELAGHLARSSGGRLVVDHAETTTWELLLPRG